MPLGLLSPWQVNDISFTVEESSQKKLHLHIGFARGSRFPDETGAACPRHDTVDRIAEVLGVNPQCVWMVFDHWIGQAREADDPSSITQLGVDETSSRKGHKYVTMGVDLEASRVIHACEGKGKETLKNIQRHLGYKGVPKEQITQLGINLSPAFIASAGESFPVAAITFDRFHVVKLLNKAMDKVRQVERVEHEALQWHKYTFLKNRQNLSDKQEKSLSKMIELYPNLGKAYRLKVLFNDLWEIPNKVAVTTFLTNWYNEVIEAQIPAFIAFEKTVKWHWSGIIHFVESRTTKGILEGINSKVQLAKRRARGYRNTGNFINMIYFLYGKLKFSYPLYFT